MVSARSSILTVRDHVLAHARLADVDIQLEQFPVNPWCAPERIIAAHCTNQRSNFLGHSGAPRLSPSNFPVPEQAEALAVPTNHRRGFHNGDGRLPFAPNRRQPRPEQPIRSCQLRSLHRPLQNSELMTKGQNLKLKGRATAKESQEGRPQRYKWRRISKSKVVRQASMYQQLRVLREPQVVNNGPIGRLRSRQDALCEISSQLSNRPMGRSNVFSRSIVNVTTHELRD